VKKKIGIVTTWFERGATHVSLAYIAALQEVYEMRVYARGGDAFPIHDLKWNKPWVHWGEFVPGAPSTTIDRRDFMRWLKREQIEILIFNEQQSWDILLYLRNTGINWPAGRPLMGAYIDYYTAQTVPFFDLYDFVLCNTKRHFSVFANHKQAVYVPWGVNVQAFPITEQSAHRPLTFFHSLGYNPDRKGTDLLVEAFTRMTNTKALLILHAQRPLRDFPALEARITGNQRITWINREVPPPGLYTLGDVYVYPSRLDGIGLSLPEALASGLPAIVTDEAPMHEFVEHGVNGWCIPVASRALRSDGYYWPLAEVNVFALIGRMDELAADPSSLQKYQRQARKHAEEHLNWMTNSAELATTVGKLTHQNCSASVLEACAQLEQKAQEKVQFKHRLHRLLITLGARKLKRAVLGRKV
jgi:glycosyltransferase involved in cell wall biosynthesis